MSPLPADYFVVRTRGKLLDRITAWFIRWWTARKTGRTWVDSPVNHAGLYIGPTDEYPEGAIIEAVRRVRYNSVTAYPDAIWSTGRLPEHLVPTDAQRLQIIAAAQAMIGDKYNSLDLLAVGLAQERAGHVVDGDEWWVKRLSDDHREICSQLVDAAYGKSGDHLFSDGRLAGLVAPEDLYALFIPAGSP